MLLLVTFYPVYKLKNKITKGKKHSVTEAGNSSCSICAEHWLLFADYRTSRLWCGKNGVSLVLPDNWSCFVLIELLFFSVAEIAASGSICTWCLFCIKSQSTLRVRGFQCVCITVGNLVVHKGFTLITWFLSWGKRSSLSYFRSTKTLPPCQVLIHLLLKAKQTEN